MIEVRAAAPEHLPWIIQRAGLVHSPGLRAIEAVEGERILGMVAYDGWTPNACSMHVAIDEVIASRRLLRPAFGIPFVELKKQVVIGTVLGTNDRALALDLHLGFKVQCRIQDAWAPGVDLIILSMRREECRWLRG